MNRVEKIILGGTVPELRKLPYRSVDMIYCDPPFGNQQDWIGAAGTFSDHWKWDRTAARRKADLGPLGAMLCDLAAAQPPAMLAYLLFMVEVMVELRRVLALHGVFFLHCDDTMGAYLRMALDLVFGPEQALGTVIWKRTSAHNNAQGSFGRVHDSIFVTARHRRGAEARAWRFPAITDVLEDHLNTMSSERVGYPTQKPVALIEKLAASAARRGEMLLDPMCGSGTALVAAIRLGLGFIGIDQSEKAIELARKRAGGGQQIGLFGTAA